MLGWLDSRYFWFGLTVNEDIRSDLDRVRLLAPRSIGMLLALILLSMLFVAFKNKFEIIAKAYKSEQK